MTAELDDRMEDLRLRLERVEQKLDSVLSLMMLQSSLQGLAQGFSEGQDEEGDQDDEVGEDEETKPRERTPFGNPPAGVEVDPEEEAYGER